jgi:hypothetical protein
MTVVLRGNEGLTGNDDPIVNKVTDKRYDLHIPYTLDLDKAILDIWFTASKDYRDCQCFFVAHF